MESLKAPKLLSKKTQKETQIDEDDVLIDATAVPVSADAVMEDVEDKPNFAPISSAEEKVNFLEYKKMTINSFHIFI